MRFHVQFLSRFNPKARTPTRLCAALSVLLMFAIMVSGSCSARWKAAHYAGDHRDEWQQPDRVIASLGLRDGQSVADLGAGGGYFTFRLSRAVGGAGRVFAVDLDPAMLEYLRVEVERRKSTNIELVEGTATDPRIPAPVDLIFLANTFHHIAKPEVYFRGLRADLKPGGRLAIVEYKKQGLFHGLLGHGADAGEVARAMERAGYRRLRKESYLERQHFQIFTPDR